MLVSTVVKGNLLSSKNCKIPSVLKIPSINHISDMNSDMLLSNAMLLKIKSILKNNCNVPRDQGIK